MYVATPTWDGGYQASGQPTYLTFDTTWVNSYSYSAPAEPAYYSYTRQVPYTYYKEETVTQDYPGKKIAQDMLMPSAGWITKVGLFYDDLGPSGDVQLLVTRCLANGQPDPTKVISQVTIPYANLKKFPAETEVVIPPCMNKAGERIGFIEITQGAHLATLGDAGYTEGTFWEFQNVFFQGDQTRDRKIKVYQAQFLTARTEVALQTLELPGGMSDIDISTEIPSMDGAELTFEAQIGGIWQRLTPDNLGRLANQPTLVPTKAVFVGSSSSQCGLMLGPNRITVSRAALSSTVVSNAIAVSAKRYFQVDLQVDRWEAAKNTVTCQLLTGAGFATVTSPTTSVVLDGDQPGFKKLRFSFDVGAAVNSFKVKDVLTRTADGAPPRRLERIAIATG